MSICVIKQKKTTNQCSKCAELIKVNAQFNQLHAHFGKQTQSRVYEKSSKDNKVPFILQLVVQIF